VKFVVAEELVLFAESVRGALRGWEAPLEPEFGSWWDDRDDDLAARLGELGWSGLWADAELLGAAVAGGIELGRAIAPLALVDEATLGGVLCVGGRGRHAEGAAALGLPLAGGGLGLADAAGGEREPTLDGTGTVRDLVAGPLARVEDGPARWRAWGVATLAYLAGLVDAALETTVAHARSREQFGAPIGALPAVQAKLADVAIARDGLVLCAWGAATDEGDPPRAPWNELAWAGGAAREATAAMLQVHGAIGFALEGGMHRFFRRAKVAQVWGDAARSAAG
jgi:hypothetical protein